MIVSQEFYLLNLIGPMATATPNSINELKATFDETLEESTLRPSERRQLLADMQPVYTGRVYELLLEAATYSQVMDTALRFAVRTAAKCNTDGVPTFFDLIEERLATPPSDEAEPAWQVWSMLEEDDEFPTACLVANSTEATRLDTLNDDLDATWEFSGSLANHGVIGDLQTTFDRLIDREISSAVLTYCLSNKIDGLVRLLELKGGRYQSRIVRRSEVSVRVAINGRSRVSQGDVLRIDGAFVYIQVTGYDTPWVNPGQFLDSVEISPTGNITIV